CLCHLYLFFLFFFIVYLPILFLHSFPTRRSSDLISIYSVNVVIESLVFSIINMSGQSSDILESVNECIVSIGILLFVVILEKTKAIKKKEFQINSSLWLWLISVPVISIIIIVIMLNSTGLKDNIIEIEIAGILIINLAIFYLYGAIQDYYKQKL